MENRKAVHRMVFDYGSGRTDRWRLLHVFDIHSTGNAGRRFCACSHPAAFNGCPGV